MEIGGHSNSRMREKIQILRFCQSNGYRAIEDHRCYVFLLPFSARLAAEFHLGPPYTQSFEAADFHPLFFGIRPAKTKRERATIEFALSRILRAALIEAEYFIVQIQH
jgi:hypothetical protein